MSVPKYVKGFVDRLKATRVKTIEIDAAPPIVGRFGISDSTRIAYRDSESQLLGRSHEYTVEVRDGRRLEVSLQLYKNTRGHWRLFVFCAGPKARMSRRAMLLSVNLSLGSRGGGAVIRLGQKLMVANRSMTSEGRARAAEAMARALRLRGLPVSEARDLDLGEFHVGDGHFRRTTAETFVRELVTAAVLKGHFMKKYALPGLSAVEGDPVLEAERSLLAAGYFDPHDESDTRKRVVTSIVQRRGQGDFRAALLAAYEGRCAVTGCDVEDALEAAHIGRYLGERSNRLQNGILLRSDIHTLFDLGKITIDPRRLCVVLADTLRSSCYRELHGRKIALPRSKSEWPSQEALRKRGEGAA